MHICCIEAAARSDFSFWGTLYKFSYLFNVSIPSTFCGCIGKSFDPPMRSVHDQIILLLLLFYVYVVVVAAATDLVVPWNEQFCIHQAKCIILQRAWIGNDVSSATCFIGVSWMHSCLRLRSVVVFFCRSRVLIFLLTYLLTKRQHPVNV